MSFSLIVYLFLVVLNFFKFYRLVYLKGYCLLFTFQCTFLFTCSLLWTSFILTHFIVFCQLFFKRFLSFFKTYFFTFFKKNFYTLNSNFFIILIKYFSLFSVFFNVLFLSGTVLYFSTFELHCQHIFYFFKKYFFNFLCSFLLKYF